MCGNTFFEFSFLIPKVYLFSILSHFYSPHIPNASIAFTFLTRHQLEFFGWPTIIQLNALRAFLAQGFQMQFTANALMSQVFNFDARRLGGKVRPVLFFRLSLSRSFIFATAQ